MRSIQQSHPVSTAFVAVLLLSSAAGSARAQQPIVSVDSVTTAVKTDAAPRGFVLVTSEAVDLARLSQIQGRPATVPNLLLRSPSTLTSRRVTSSEDWSVSPILPQFVIVSNSALPLSQNLGSLWAGKGVGTRTTFGARLENSRLRIIAAPEFVTEENRDWVLRHYPYNQPHNTPAVPPDRAGAGFVFPFYVNTFPIDQPLRFGAKRVTRLDPGESGVFASAGKFEIGISTEHEWWGPGIRNALVLSNNAPGFPHAIIRTAHPVRTRFGNLDARWLVGGLTESKYFDTVSTNNVRSLASIAATLQTKWDPDLTFGVARSVFATASGWGAVPFRWFDVLANTHRPDARAVSDTTLRPGGKDQIFSLFARWVFPADGFEVYAEWARTQLPHGLRDFLISPNHTQGYTMGLQCASKPWRSGTFRIQTDVTQLEQSPTRRDGPMGSWYASRPVVQGYTNRGEVLGASIGPGASSQWVATDYIRNSWRLGVFAGRTRWNEDVHNATRFPVYVNYCNHDVSLYPGARGAVSGKFGALSVDYSLQNRLNAFFQNDGGCPNVGERLDIRNNTLTITFSPFEHR